MKILLVEDDVEISEMLKNFLVTENFEVVTAYDGESACEKFFADEYSIVLLDLMIPKISGMEVMKTIRASSTVPIMILSAKDTDSDKTLGLGLGADDYIAKPFLPQELLFRIYAVLRRCDKEDTPFINLDGCTIDFGRAEVHKAGKTIPLTAKEHIFLETLARSEGRIVTVDTLCEALWGDNPFGYENSLNAHVRRIREKIEADPSNPVSLITVKGLGYKLNTRK